MSFMAIVQEDKSISQFSMYWKECGSMPQFITDVTCLDAARVISGGYDLEIFNDVHGCQSVAIQQNLKSTAPSSHQIGIFL